MEAQTEIQTYLEQGRTALAQGRAREAAIAYTYGAQLEPDNPAVHLGLAEANLGLGNYGVVQMACRKVLELQPEQGSEARIAQVLLDLLERRYEQALKTVDVFIQDDPGNAYVHALRSYLLRANGQDYDANLARARATRLSYGGRFENIFPALEPPPEPRNKATTSATPTSEAATRQRQTQVEREREPVPTWSRPNRMRRQLIRTRFALSQRPGLFTNILIGIFLAFFVLVMLDQSGQVILQTAPLIPEILAGQVWRLVTGIFLVGGLGNILDLLMIMLSLFFVGRAVEIFYGPIRYLGIFLFSGMLGGILPLFFGVGFGMGATGAMMGIFGALGAFYIANRRVLGGFGSSAMLTWVFWLVLLLVFNLSGGGGIKIVSIDIALLLITMMLSFLLLPRSGNRNLRF